MLLFPASIHDNAMSFLAPSDCNILDLAFMPAALQLSLLLYQLCHLEFFSAGSYSGSGNSAISFNGKAITVSSCLGAPYTALSLSGAARAFLFNSDEIFTSVLKGKVDPRIDRVCKTWLYFFDA